MSDEQRNVGGERDLIDETGGLDIAFDPGTTDLGDDVYRDDANRGSVLGSAGEAGTAGIFDPGNADLGDDVYRDTTNRDGVLDGGGNTGLDGALDPGNADLGPDVYRDADED